MIFENVDDGIPWIRREGDAVEKKRMKWLEERGR